MELNATIFLQVFIFLTLLLWLSKTLFAPILRLFEEREQRIEGARRIAAELSSLADEKAQAFQIHFDQAKLEARHTLAELKHAMDKDYSQALEAAKMSAREKLTAAELELAAHEQSLRAELAGKSAGLADDIVMMMSKRSTT